MINKVECHVALNGIREIRVQGHGPELSDLDKAIIIDRKGNIVVIDGSVIWQSLVAICRLRNITPEQFVEKMRKKIGNEEDVQEKTQS